MENIEFIKEASGKLYHALKTEHLWTKDAAKLLNINPVYVTMMMNPSTFNKTSKAAHERLKEWIETGDTISNFKYPEGEKTWEPTPPAAKETESSSTEKPARKTSSKKSSKKTKTSDKFSVETAPIDKDTSEAIKKLSAGIPSVSEVLSQTMEKSPKKLAKEKAKKSVDQVDDKAIEAAADRIWRKLEKRLAAEVIMPPVSVSTENTLHQAVALDIEINLVVNGNRVQIG
jgi:hypothetical protein